MIVRELVAMLGVKTDSESFDKAEGGLERLAGAAKAAIAALAAFKGIQFLKGIVDETNALADTFDKMSLRTGESAESLQKWSFVGELSGTNARALETSIKKLQVSMDEAGQGTKEYLDDFKRLGVEVKNTDGTMKTYGQILPEIADGLNKLETDTERAAVASKLLGRAGTQMLPMLKQGAEGIKAMMEEAEELGGVMSDTLVKMGAEYIDNTARIDLAIRGVKNTITEALLPSFIEMQEGTIKWIKANREWISLHIGEAFKRLGEFIKNIGEFVGDAAKGVIEWGRNLDPLESKILKIGLAIAGIAALMMMPGGAILLLIGLVLLLIEDFVVWKRGGNSLIGSLIGDFEEYEETLNAIGDTLKLLKDAWVAYITDLTETFAAFVLFVMEAYEGDLWEAAVNFGDRLSEIWGGVINEMKEFWSEAGEFVSNELNFWYLKIFADTIIWLNDTNKAVTKWAENLVGKITEPFKEIGKFFGDFFGSEKVKQLNVVTSAVNAGENVSPRAGAGIGAGAGNMRNNFNNEIKVEVNATGGIGEHNNITMIGQVVKEALEKENREAIRTLRPLAE